MKKIWLFHLLVVLFISCEKSDNIPDPEPLPTTAEI